MGEIQEEAIRRLIERYSMDYLRILEECTVELNKKGGFER